MTELQTDPSVIKLLEYAKTKKTISYDEVNDFLPEHIANSDKIDEVSGRLQKNQTSREEEDLRVEEVEEAARPAPKKDVALTVRHGRGIKERRGDLACAPPGEAR